VNRQVRAIEDQDLAVEQDHPRRVQRQTVSRSRHYKTSIGTSGPSQVNGYSAKHVYAPSQRGLRTSWPLRMIRFKFDGKFKGKFDGDFSGRFNRWRSATKSEPRLPRLGCRKQQRHPSTPRATHPVTPPLVTSPLVYPSRSSRET
jgi:hypothetical protein